MLKRFNILTKLIAVNLIVFLVINFVDIVVYLFDLPDIANKILGVISVPSNMKDLLFKFWTPFTYMFVQQSFWHILGNMLWLYFIGVILLDTISEKDFLALYILGGLAGAFLYIISFNIFPAFSDVKIYSILLGASGAVTAIVITTAVLRPNETLYFFGIIKIRLFIIAILMIVYDFFLLKGDNAGGHFAHIGGALYGLIYGLQMKKGNNFSAGFANFLNKISIKNIFRKKSKIKVIKNNLSSKNDYQYNQTKQEIRAEIDRILDKISAEGYKSLSKKERDFLKTHSKNM